MNVPSMEAFSAKLDGAWSNQHAVVYETNIPGNRKTIDRCPKENTQTFVLRGKFLLSQHEN